MCCGVKLTRFISLPKKSKVASAVSVICYFSAVGCMVVFIYAELMDYSSDKNFSRRIVGTAPSFFPHVQFLPLQILLK
jgi:ABC-type lipoprotein release transport system permease subunit